MLLSVCISDFDITTEVKKPAKASNVALFFGGRNWNGGGSANDEFSDDELVNLQNAN